MPAVQLKVITVHDPEYADVWHVREEVLRKPLGLSLKNEDLSRDRSDDIVIAIADDRVIGCVMLHPMENNVAKLRAMAVLPQYQGKGIGTMLVRQFEAHAGQKGYKKISLHARQVAVGFYMSLGYAIASDTFTEVGILHVVMEKDLGN